MAQNVQILIKSENETPYGLFGQTILWITEFLPTLDKYNMNLNDIFWDIKTETYGSIFPNILLFNNNTSIKDNINVTRFIDMKNKLKLYTIGDDFKKINELFFKYFSIPKELDNRSLNYINSNDFLGLHYRGTDKNVDACTDNTHISKKEFVTIVENYLKNNNDIKNIFIASDESDIYYYFKDVHYNYNIIKAQDYNRNESLFWHKRPDPEKNAQDAMIDMLCLSKCKIVIKSSSALSAFAKVVNPSLEIYRVNACRMFSDVPYFPDAYIPLFKKSKDYSEQTNDILTKVQEDDWSFKHYDKFNNFFIKERSVAV